MKQTPTIRGLFLLLNCLEGTKKLLFSRDFLLEQMMGIEPT